MGTGPASMLALLTATALVAGMLVWMVRRYALRRDVVDYPNVRSSHERPTPRGGGIGIVAPVVAFLVATGGAQDSRWLMAGVIVVVAVVGWIDDHTPLPSLPRLLVHIVAGVAVAWVSRAFDLDIVPGVGGAVALAWWVFWTAATINVTNFMDGIDAMIGLQLLVFGAFAAAMLGGDPWAGALAVVTVGAGLGFLAFNWPPARIFLGDVGSGSVGVVFVILGMLTMAARGWSVIHAFLPLMPLFADELVTMVRRVRRGDSLLQAHRTHFYQRLVRADWPHARVAVVYAFGSALSAAWAIANPTWSATFLAGVAALLAANIMVAAAGPFRNDAASPAAPGPDRR